MNEKIYECPICSIYGVNTSIYKDARGWQYKVMKNKDGLFQPYYRKPSENKWKPCKNFKARVVDGSAQIDLDEWVVKKGMREDVA